MNTSDIIWKYRQHRDFIRTGMKHSIFKDLLSKENRNKTFESWYELPRMIAKSVGCEFTKETPSIALNEIFVEKIYEVEGFMPNPNDTVCDIGASYGDSAIWWSKLKGANVLSFEPLSDIFRILEDNIALNRARVKAYNMAIGSGNFSMSSREGNMLGKSNVANSPMIETTRMDDLGIPKIDLLKIDVEGFELDVLKGAVKSIKKLKPRIIIETHSTDLRNSCDKFLKSMGYSLEVQGRKVRPKQGWMDVIQNLFYSI